MKKFIPIIIVGILVLSGLGAAAFTTNVSIKTNNDRKKRINIGSFLVTTNTT